MSDAAAARSAGSATVLIAVEDSADESVSIVRTAHRLFGDDATYLVINVGSRPYDDMAWAFVSPVMSPMAWYPPVVSSAQAVEMADTATGDAEQEAADAVAAASIEDATALGDLGDPASAIMAAAHEHHADVVVVGSHDRAWFSRLFNPSVSDQIVREGDLPVLVVK